MGRWDDGTLGRFDLRSSLLTLGRFQASLTLLLLTRNLDLRSNLLTLGRFQASLVLLLLTRNLAPMMAVYGLNPSVTLPPHDDVTKSALRAIVLQRTKVIA